MSSTLSKIEIWNTALDLIVEHPLQREQDDNTYARWLRRNDDLMRDSFLRMHPWNFATQLNALSVDGTTPSFRWSYRYKLPADCLRVIPPTYLGKRDGNPVPFEVSQGYIYCNIPTTLYLRTVQRIYDYTEWDPLAVDAFAHMLAHRMTMRFTAKATYKDRMKQDAADMFRLATENDVLEASSEPVEQHDVIDVRMS